MTKFKQGLLLFTIIVSFNLCAQQQSGSGAGRPKPPTIKAEDMCEIIILKPEKVVKKMKLDDDALQDSITLYINSYNSSIEVIKQGFQVTLKSANKKIKLARDMAMASRDRSRMSADMHDIRTKLATIKELVQTNREILNIQIKNLTKQKSYERWEKYIDAKLKALIPQSPSGGSGQMGRGGAGGTPPGN